MNENIESFQEDFAENIQVEPKAVEADGSKEAEPKPDSGYIDFDSLPEEHRERVKMRIDGDYRKLKEMERKQAEADRKARELEEKLNELNKPREVQAPTADDFIDNPEEAQRRMAQYTDYLAQQKDWEYQKKLHEQKLAEQKAMEAARVQNEVFTKAKNAGIDENELRYSAAVLMQSGIGDSTADYLLQHEYAPQLINQLAKNPVELQVIANLSPYQVGAKLDQMASAFKPNRTSRAPAPDDPIMGAGVDANEDPLLKGSTIL